MQKNTLSLKLLELQKNLYSYALSLTLNQEDAKDLVQSTSLKVLNSQEKLQQESNVKGWIYTIMKNLFINDYHKCCKHRVVSSNSYNEDGDTLFSATTSSCTDSSSNLKEIKRAIQNLPSEYRIPFGLYTVGYKYQEIADKLNLPIGTVKSRIHHCRTVLKVELKDFLHE